MRPTPQTQPSYRHVETRWLTLVPALEKVLERWDASKEYFLEYLPKQKDFKKGAAKNDRYKRIASMKSASIGEHNCWC